jgi:hypothetical protein
MEVDSSIELGPDDPTLEIPWSDPEGRLHYFNLKLEPASLALIPEAAQFPELRAFLELVNSRECPLESAKCDAWSTTELQPVEEIFDEPWKFATYIDLLFTDPATRDSFSDHERYLKALTASLRSEAEIAASAEFILRRCFSRQENQVREGFYFTAYVFGYGPDESQAQRRCSVALRAVSHALLPALRTPPAQKSAL